MKSQVTTRRGLGIVVALLGLSLCIYVVANGLSYFKRGAEKLNKYDLGVHQLENHQPEVVWMLDDIDIKGEINPYVRKEIEQSYIDAWGILNLSLVNQEDLGLGENYTDRKVKQINSSMDSTLFFFFFVFFHHLKLHFISYDKQVVSFSDYNVIVETTIVKDNYKTTIRDTADYKIVMALEDGKWKINKFYREAIQ